MATAYTLYGNVSGTWEELTPYANVSGTWEAVQEIYQNQSGTWTLIWALLSINFDFATVYVENSETDVIGGVGFNSSGQYYTIKQTVETDYDFIVSGIDPSNVEVMASVNSGSTPSGSDVDTWLNMSTDDPYWYVTVGGNTSTSIDTNLTLSARNATTLESLGSGTTQIIVQGAGGA